MNGDDQGSGEDRLIARLFRPLATAPGALNLSDDAAFLTPPEGYDIVLTTDAVTSGVHFFPDAPGDGVARRALRVNLSDLAAKGARPLGFLMSVALPASVTEDWLDAFARGLAADIGEYDCPLYGGDTDRTTGPLSINIAMIGSVPKGTMVKRSGAKPGDLVLVSGTVGDAALGVRLRGGEADWKIAAANHEYLVERFRLPQPRLALAEALRANASAAMDISDGLAGDLAKLCRVSGVAAEVDVRKVPLSEAARAVLALDSSAQDSVLTGGDDYEILCTAAPEKAAALQAAAAAAKVPLTAIGTVKAGAGARILDAAGKPMHFTHASYSHF
ncbi:MAG: thiamine-phosphate kinase [Pseudolabrys sp.]|nr:thiamine-phosphate kinase [Pseudolabrys sp.]